MPKKRARTKDNAKSYQKKQKREDKGLHPHTKRALMAVLLFVLSLVWAFGLVGKGGAVGSYLSRFLVFAFGFGVWVAPFLFISSGIILIRTHRTHMNISLGGGGMLFFISVVTLFGMVGGDSRWGGTVGGLIASPLENLFGMWVSVIIALGLLAFSTILFFNIPFGMKREESGGRGLPLEDLLLPERKSHRHPGFLNAIVRSIPKPSFSVSRLSSSLPAHQDLTTHIERETASRDMESYGLRPPPKKIPYKKPPTDLLDPETGESSGGNIKANINIIKRTLQNFNIDVEMGEVNIGPTVTQYTLKPAEGVKLSKITVLASDLSLALAAHPIRIEAPIPGKALVGIEIPNKQKKLVRIRNIVENQNFSKSPAELLLALGQDVAGNPVFTNLEKMPHFLVAGSTGSGKTICLNGIIITLLYKNSPKTLRFVLVDPKRVEFPVYNGLPHLLTPVITDVNKTISALRWLVGEMERRFGLLAAAEARDIATYNSGLRAIEEGEGKEYLPYLVVIIDELADLMAARPREIEQSIVRLAQMARAVGIHIVVATQRPSVEVITGLIKANITSRIAFQVASQVDSRTILDMSGAEKLLGNGDMLFVSAENIKPKRIQGAFISDKEVKRVVQYIKETQKPDAPSHYDEGEILESHSSSSQSLDDSEEYRGEKDPLYKEAKQLVLETHRASASFLQRRLSIGYARAARLLDLMEEEGIVGPGEGAKPREVYGGTTDGPRRGFKEDDE